MRRVRTRNCSRVHVQPHFWRYVGEGQGREEGEEGSRREDEECEGRLDVPGQSSALLAS